MKKELKGLKALVTGGAKRIGRELALALAREGCELLVHYNQSQREAEETLQEIRKLGVRGELVQADFSKNDAPTIILDAVKKKFDGKLDILINNASSYPLRDQLKAENDLLSETPESWDQALNVNAKTPFFLIQKLAPILLESNHARVLNILDSSISKPFLSRASHSVSKAALVAVTKLAAGSLGPKVCVNGLELGAIIPPVDASAEQLKNLDFDSLEDVTKAVIKILQSNLNGEILLLEEINSRGL